MEIDAAKFYKYMGPRTLALVTSADKDKHISIEPVSFITPVSMKPPMVALSIGAKQETVKNIRNSRQFMINIPSEDILQKVVIFLGPEAHEPIDPERPDRLEKAGLNSVPASKIIPPMIYECVAWLECLLEYDRDFGDRAMVVGTVVNVTVRDEILAQDGSIDIGKAKMLMHIGGMKFSVAERVINAKREEAK